MGRIPNNNISKKQVLDSLTDAICKGEYVLVLGADVVLKEEYGGGNSTLYIEEEFNKEHTAPFPTIDDRKREIMKFLGEGSWNYDLEEVSEDLIQLIRTKCFRVVLTTTYDAYIEAVMKDTYGEELRVLNFHKSKDRSIIFDEKSEYDVIPPTLYYAFGKAGSDDISDYTYSENDKIKLISQWLGVNSPNNLISYLKSKKILAIGCKFDDWHFRFFWYCLRQDFGCMRGDVAISLQEGDASDRKLSGYLERIGVRNRGNSREFMRELGIHLQNNYIYQELRERLSVGQIFISYASEDFRIVYQIASTLWEAGYKVWFDNDKLCGGDGYDKRIESAINGCTVFVPVLSRQTKQDIIEHKYRYYKDEEWVKIKDNKKAKIIPITIYGFNIATDRDLLPESFTVQSAINSSINWTEESKENLINSLRKYS